MIPHVARACRHAQRHEDNDGGMAQREEESDADRLLALLHQFSRYVVDCRDVIGIDGVAQAKAVGEKAEAQAPWGKSGTAPAARAQAATFRPRRKR